MGGLFPERLLHGLLEADGSALSYIASAFTFLDLAFAGVANLVRMLRELRVLSVGFIAEALLQLLVQGADLLLRELHAQIWY